MNGARDILERRLLAALDATSRRELPEPWGALRPKSDDALRPAAAVLLGLAQLPSVEAMTSRLTDIAGKIADRRSGREGGEQEVWRNLAGALEKIGELRPGSQGLLGLALWGPSVPLTALNRSFRGLLREAPEPGETFRTAAARTLLRALARTWTEQARRNEKESEV